MRKGRPIARRTAIALVTSLLLAAGAAAVTGQPAMADVCSTPWTNPSGGTATVQANDVNYRSGPWLSCDPYGTWDRGTYLYLHCYRVGTNVNGTYVWWHARRAGTDQEGWITAYYLPNSDYFRDPEVRYYC